MLRWHILNSFLRSIIFPMQNSTLAHPSVEPWCYSRSPSPNLGLIDPVLRVDISQKKSQKKISHKGSHSNQKPGQKDAYAKVSEKAKKQSLGNLSLADKIIILDFVHAEGKGWSQTDIVKHVKKQLPQISQPNLCRWLRDEKELRLQASNITQLRAKRFTKVAFPSVEESLAIWIMQKEAQGVRITGDVIKVKALYFADLHGIPKNHFLSLSNGWLDKYKQRHGLKQYRFHGEAGSINEEDVEAARAKAKEQAKGYELRDIYNMDETALFYALPPDTGLASKQYFGIKKNRKRLTFALITNADGSDQREPLIIGHAQCPRSFQKKQGIDLGFPYYYWNKKAWMMASIFQW